VFQLLIKQKSRFLQRSRKRLQKNSVPFPYAGITQFRF